MNARLLVAAAAIALLPASLVGELTASTTFAFESEYVFRGEPRAAESFQPSLDLTYGGLYGGLWANLPADDVDSTGADFENELRYYAGYILAVTDWLTLDGGFTYYDLTESVPGPDALGLERNQDKEEVHLAARFDTLFEPELRGIYELQLDIWFVQLSLTHTVELGGGLSLELLAYGGYSERGEETINTLDPFGGPLTGTAKGKSWYAGAAVDLVYAFTENVSASLGGRVATRDVENDVTLNGVPSGADITLDSLWWGASFTAGF